jgi:signal transduction histidine kinase
LDLAEVFALPGSGGGLTELYNLIVERAYRLLGADRCAVFDLESESGELVPRASRGFQPDELAPVRIPRGKGFIGRACRDIQTRVLDDEAGDDPFVARFPSGYAITSPIKVEGEVTAMLYLARDSDASLGADELNLWHLLTDRCGMAVSFQRLVSRAARQGERLRELTTLLTAAAAGEPLHDVLARSCQAGCAVLDVAAVIAIAEPGDRERIGAAYGLDSAEVGDWSASWEDRLTTGHPAVRALGFTALLPVPIVAGDHWLGIVYFLDRGVRTFTPDEHRAAELVGALMGTAVDRAVAFEGTQRVLRRMTAIQDRLVKAEKARALAGVAGGIAHEFNNLLAIILGKTELARDRAGAAEIREDLAVIEETAWRAADTVRRLLTFVSTRRDDAMCPVDLNAIVEDAVTFTRPLWKDDAEARGIGIEVITALGEGTIVEGNATELREAVISVLLNAIDAMPRGGRIAIRTEVVSHAARVAISDSGDGMPPAVQHRMFDPFFTTRSPQRVGLGLSVVQGIVGRHQGGIDVQSTEGRGTTITLALPRARGHSVAAEDLTAGTAPGRAGAILVIEDEAYLREMLVDTLTAAGHLADGAADGLDGLARFQRGSYAVVVTDLSMPERSGLDVARAVKGMSPQTSVILISGWGEVMTPERMAGSGVDFVLDKPFKIDRVLTVVETALGRRHLR